MFLEENAGLYEEGRADQLVVGGIIKPGLPINERSESQRVYPQVPCPRCNTAITAILETDDEKPIFRCDPCKSEATFSLQVFSQEVSYVDSYEVLALHQETHVVSVEVEERRKQIYSIKMNCLSCRKPMAKKELHDYNPVSGTPTYDVIYCPSNCRVRTFLQVKADDRGIYIQPYLEAYNDIPRPDIVSFEIPRSTHPSPVLESSPDDTQPESVSKGHLRNLQGAKIPLSPPHSPISPETFQKPTSNPTGKHVGFKAQILTLLKQARRPLQRKEIHAALVGTENKIDDAIKGLLKDGYIKKVGHGKYLYVKG